MTVRRTFPSREALARLPFAPVDLVLLAGVCVLLYVVLQGGARVRRSRTRRRGRRG